MGAKCVRAKPKATPAAPPSRDTLHTTIRMYSKMPASDAKCVGWPRFLGMV